ncbi:hypothetical protein HNP49_001257 [Pseudomonas fluvialis]|uniref:DUF4124 domain-containing protein n=1 Tax=Pseudomonas fluvialis TaxID=1793966 RepID=A0A7X0BSP8_9PSED|nr:outer membrane protein assembly factor BamE [Pseudomonas fluvialis]MBB6341100.1 hypothetical protein [Pseudomonas fluvialis]
MHGSLKSGLFGLYLLFSQASFATSVFRCEDMNGHVTYTLSGCPVSHDQTIQHASNPTPSSGRPTLMAAPSKNTKSGEHTDNQGPTVVGARDDGCGNQLSTSEKRSAVIRKEVRRGMTRSDIESALGKPDNSNEQNGQARYVYKDQDGRKRQISFDENGCVRSKR